MENKLSCAVVRDLLPLYADDLVSDETRAEVDGHLETCPACSAVLRDIRPEVREPEAERKHVDFLRKVRTRGRKRAAVTTIAGILLNAILPGKRDEYMPNQENSGSLGKY